jgi:hypothetical protein
MTESLFKLIRYIRSAVLGTAAPEGAVHEMVMNVVIIIIIIIIIAAGLTTRQLGGCLGRQNNSVYVGNLHTKQKE